MTFFYLTQFYYSYHAVLRENVLELFAFAIISTLTTAAGAYRFLAIAIGN